MEKSFDSIVVGAGAAGLMAAIFAAKRGLKTCVVERNEKAGKKIYITGKGRCNITNSCDAETFFDSVLTNSKFMYSSFYSFDNYMVVDFFENLGLKTKIERGNRVFPVSDKSSDVIKCLTDQCEKLDIEIFYNTRISNLLISPEKQIIGVKSEKGMALYAPNVLIATGGKSYPSTGSTGDGYIFATELGHGLNNPKPGLVPMNVKEDDCREMQGLSLRNVKLKILDSKAGKTVYEDFGELMFTHFGITGPLVLSASSLIKNDIQNLVALIDCKPALDEAKLDKRILRDFEENINHNIKNVLNKLLPKSMIPIVLRRAGIDPGKKVNFITKDERKRLLDNIKNLEFHISSLRNFNEAIITRGGVDVHDVNPHTMESKHVNGLYFAGEVLDVDALTGGFNLQIAWSTGALAGNSFVSQMEMPPTS